MISQKEPGVGLTGGRRISEFLSRVNSFFPSRLWSFSSIFLVTEPFGFNRRLSLPSSQLWRGREVEVHKRATIELTGTWKLCLSKRLSALIVSYIENMRVLRNKVRALYQPSMATRIPSNIAKPVVNEKKLITPSFTPR